MLAGVTNVLEVCASRLTEMIDDIRVLVECESPSDDLSAIERSADAVAAQGLARLGVAPEHITLEGRAHLLWRLGDGPRRVLLLGHHDTVWPIGTLDRIPFSATNA